MSFRTVAVSDSKDVTTLLLDWSAGSSSALHELIPRVYDELRQIAGRSLRRECAGHTLQTTALVHEAYLKLIDQRKARFTDREHFFAVASQIIRRILISHARQQKAQKRGGGETLLAFDESFGYSRERKVDLIALDAALETLSRLDAQQSRVIELRFFGGLSIEATARALGISTATVTRDWRIARAWLYRELKESANP